MARGILSGVISCKLVNPKSIFVYDSARKASGAFKSKFGVQAAPDARSVFQRTDVVLLAVKPQNLSDALKGLRESKVRARWLITILAGVPRSKVSLFLPKTVRVVRAMPNLGATVGASYTALCGSDRRAVALAGKIFEACGTVTFVSESKMDLVTVLGGSGPAYFFLLMEILAEQGIKCGLSKKVAETLAVQTAWGAAMLASVSRSASPSMLRRAVTSKGGTTEAAVRCMETMGIRKIFGEAIRRGLKRARQLGRRS